MSSRSGRTDAPVSCSGCGEFLDVAAESVEVGLLGGVLCEDCATEEDR